MPEAMPYVVQLLIYAALILGTAVAAGTIVSALILLTMWAVDAWTLRLVANPRPPSEADLAAIARRRGPVPIVTSSHIKPGDITFSYIGGSPETDADQ